ncbi:MAG: TlpA family protein disulfide reductase [Firmicutes bacterium]|nr:TlpA family protein disulfide reductase [Bacillota bacterium]
MRSLPLFLAASLMSIGLVGQTPAKGAKAAKPAPKPAPKAAPAPKAGPLTVGDAAPALKVGRWVKGGPVASLQKGKVYVVEFWATWCGPCRETIPHLTKMAKAHAGKATFIGVNVWERGAGPALEKRVDDFVKEMGDKMDYAVARDSDNVMAKTWMEAAQQRGIPAAFIVDAKGLIAFIGHPGEDDFEKILDEVIAGKYDLKAAKAKAEKEAAEQAALEAKALATEAAWEKASPAINEAVKAKDWSKVLTLADAAQAEAPGLADHLKRPRFLALAATDPAKAQALIDEALKTPSVQSYMESAILMSENGLDKKWSEQALTLIDKAVALEPRIAPNVGPYRFNAVLHHDMAKAKTIWDAAKTPAEKVKLAPIVVAQDGVDKAWLESVTATLEETQKGGEPNPRAAMALAEAYYKLGRNKEAVTTFQSFLDFAKNAGAPAQFLKEGEETLKKYQGGK